MDIYSNIRKKREDKKYSQEYIASKLGMSQNAYSRIEQGLAKIYIDRLIQIAEVLETTVTDLIDTSPKQTVNITNNQTVNGNVTNNTSVEEMKAFYEKLIQEKENSIKSKNEQIQLFKTSIELLQKK